MSIRVALIVTLAAALAAPAGAQPDKKDSQAKVPPASVAAQVVLASASDVKGPKVPETNRPAQSVRRPAPRVTTCRCGDPQPAEDQQPDE